MSASGSKDFLSEILIYTVSTDLYRKGLYFFPTLGATQIFYNPFCTYSKTSR